MWSSQSFPTMSSKTESSSISVCSCPRWSSSLRQSKLGGALFESMHGRLRRSFQAHGNAWIAVLAEPCQVAVLDAEVPDERWRAPSIMSAGRGKDTRSHAFDARLAMFVRKPSTRLVSVPKPGHGRWWIARTASSYDSNDSRSAGAGK